jgi:aspartyl-tRNA(Asn)/glutamyl-tRNA(Gln) amidotransferase subunit C
MKIDQETLEKIAHLARLEVPVQEQQEMLESLSSVLTWMEQLDAIDTSGVAPLTHISTENNVFRPDTVVPSLSTEQGLRNAPQSQGPYFGVPKVIE